MWERLSSREINHRGWKAAPTFNITCSFWITGFLIKFRNFAKNHFSIFLILSVQWKRIQPADYNNHLIYLMLVLLNPIGTTYAFQHKLGQMVLA